MSKGSTFWRQAGLSYLQYLSIASRALRTSLKVSDDFIFLREFIQIIVKHFFLSFILCV